LPHEDFIKFYKNLNSRDKDHNSVQKQIIEEFVSLKNNFNMSEVIGDLNNEISTDEIKKPLDQFVMVKLHLQI
jgi:hypothetical protein